MVEFDLVMDRCDFPLQLGLFAFKRRQETLQLLHSLHIIPQGQTIPASRFKLLTTTLYTFSGVPTGSVLAESPAAPLQLTLDFQ
jgi:hypothetical protein